MKIITRNCNECQALYEAEPRYVNRGQGLFCTRDCAGAYNGRLRQVKHDPNTMCAWCGIDFYRQNSHKKSKSGTYYCSVQHQDLGAASGIHKNGPERSRISFSKCFHCGEKLPNKSYKEGAMHSYCRTPYKISLWLSGDNSATLNRSGTTGLPVDTKEFVKKYLIQTRGDKCEQCGFDEKAPDGRSIIQMDHINGNCFDNRLENLKLLCPNHHVMTSTYGRLNTGSGRAQRRKVK